MFMMAKNFDEAKKMLNVAMAEKYPDTFSIAIFIDDGIKRGFCTENSIDEMQIKKTLTACYQSALDVLNDYSAESKNENSGIKLTIKKKDSKLKVRDFILTDDEIKAFATDFVKYVKDVLSENYKSGKTHGDYHSGCHFGYDDMVDAATYGANAVYDLMLKKIMDYGAAETKRIEKILENKIDDVLGEISNVIPKFEDKTCESEKEPNLEKLPNNEICYCVYIPTKMNHTDIENVNLILNQHEDEFILQNYVFGRDYFLIAATNHLVEMLMPIINKYKQGNIGSAIKLK